MNKLVLDVKPENQCAYGSLQIGFYDRPCGKDRKPQLYIKFQNSDDKFSVVDRKVGSIKVLDEQGNYIFAEETKLYQRAYDKYLVAKNSEGEVDYKALAIQQAAELEALKAKKEDVSSDNKLKELSYKEIKEKLSELGIQFKENAPKKALLELLEPYSI